MCRFTRILYSLGITNTICDPSDKKQKKTCMYLFCSYFCSTVPLYFTYITSSKIKLLKMSNGNSRVWNHVQDSSEQRSYADTQVLCPRSLCYTNSFQTNSSCLSTLQPPLTAMAEQVESRLCSHIFRISGIPEEGMR